MPFHFSEIFLSAGMLIPLLVAFLVWRKISENSKKLFAEKEQKTISLITALLLFGWFAVVVLLALIGVYHVRSDFLSPLVPIGVVVPGVLVLGLVLFSSTVKKIVDSLSMHWLISLQLFRVLGIVFLWQLEAGRLPGLFAIPSGYGDIIIGITAPIVAFICLKKIPFSKIIAFLWNIFGILDLVVSICLGVLLAFPAPFQLVAVTPTTEIMTMFPMVLVPVYAVPLAFILHVFCLRGLFNKK